MEVSDITQRPAPEMPYDDLNDPSQSLRILVWKGRARDFVATAIVASVSVIRIPFLK